MSYDHYGQRPQVPLADMKVLVKDDSDFKRKVKEANAIYKNRPALNRDRGHKIPPILLQLVSCDCTGQCCYRNKFNHNVLLVGMEVTIGGSTSVYYHSRCKLVY